MHKTKQSVTLAARWRSKQVHSPIRRTPLVFENVQANVAILVYIRMEAGCLKLDCWSFERVVIGELEGELVAHAFIDCVSCTLYCPNPRK